MTDLKKKKSKSRCDRCGKKVSKEIILIAGRPYCKPCSKIRKTIANDSDCRTIHIA